LRLPSRPREGGLRKVIEVKAEKELLDDVEASGLPLQRLRMQEVLEDGCIGGEASLDVCQLRRRRPCHSAACTAAGFVNLVCFVLITVMAALFGSLLLHNVPYVAGVRTSALQFQGT
jgi:hypothetical protein